MDKALAESDEAKKAVDKQEESLVVLEKKIPDEETLTKTRTEELKKRTTVLAEPEKKEKAALAETAQLEKATKQKEAALAPVLQKIEQNEKQTKPLKAQLVEVEKMIKQLEGMPEQLKQANQKKAGLVAKLKPLQEQRVGFDKQAGDFRKQVTESQKAFDQAKAKSDLAVKEADRLRKEKKEAEDSLAQAKTKLAETQKEVADLKKSLTTAKADLKKKEDALAKAEKEYQDLENPRLQFVRDLERAKEDLVKADAKIKEYQELAARSDEDLKKSEEASKRAKEKVAEDAKRLLASIEFSVDGKAVVTLDQSGLVNLMVERKRGKMDRVPSGCRQAGRFFGRVGQKFGFVDQDGVSSVIDLKREWTLDHMIGGDLAQTPIVHRVSALAFAPDGKLLASGGGDPSRTGEIIVWDLAKKSMLKHFPDIHSDMVNSVEFSRDGKLLVSWRSGQVRTGDGPGDGQATSCLRGAYQSRSWGQFASQWEDFGQRGSGRGGQGLEFGQWGPGGKTVGLQERDYLHPFHRLD